MSEHLLTDIKEARFNKERDKIELDLNTDSGLLTLKVSPDHLAALITVLNGIETHLSMFDPKAGPKPGEQVQLKVEIVDHLETGTGDADGVPSALVGLKSGPVFRWFALDKAKAERLARSVEAEVAKLGSARGTH